PDLDYAPAVGGKLAMDIVRPRDNAGAPHPAVLCIHGGGFRAGNRQSYLPLCIKLAQRGYVAATVTYRLAPKSQFPAPLHDVEAAEVLPQFLGGDLEHARAAHIKASPLNWVSPSSAPVLAVHGTKDRYVAYEQSQWLVDRLHAVGVEADLATMEGSDHGFKGD